MGVGCMTIRMAQTIVAHLAIVLFFLGCQPTETSTSGAADDEQDDMVVTQPDGGSDGRMVTPVDCRSAGFVLESNTIALTCETADIRFAPSVNIDSVWVEADACERTDDIIVCNLADAGTIQYTLGARTVSSTYTANRPQSFGGVRLNGSATMTDAKAWLSNGYQSWSQSGVIQIPISVSDIELKSALRARSDAEVIRLGTANSWWHTFVKADTSLVVGTTTARLFKTWITVSGQSPDLSVMVTSGGIDETIAMGAEETVVNETVFVALDSDVNNALESYGAALPHRATSLAKPEAGWNSWYELWDTVDEEAIRANAILAGDYLRTVLPAHEEAFRIVIDDGWQKAWGDWTANEKFPSGLEQLATDLKADGFETGIWLAPLLVHEDVPLTTEKPDWFIADTTYTHLTQGPMKILDVTHPDAAAHLTQVIESVVSKGFDLLKIDFLFAGTYEAPRHENRSAIESYNMALQIIRQAAGPNTILLSVGSPPIAGFEYIDAWRVGPDVAVGAFDASWFFVPNVGRTIAARWPYCLTLLCDGDPPILRTLSQTEVVTGSWAAAFSGGALFLSDDLRNLDPTRLPWLKPEVIETALAGVPARPDPMPEMIPDSLVSALSDQLSSRSRHAVPTRWTLPNDRQIWINWTDESAAFGSVEIDARSAVMIDDTQ
ncbi:MAG: hypothetical protein CMH52_13930 [Myxococcales bacterium]|nr:hypothetical protein [Myxococcales bacterium]